MGLVHLVILLPIMIDLRFTLVISKMLLWMIPIMKLLTHPTFAIQVRERLLSGHHRREIWKLTEWNSWARRIVTFFLLNFENVWEDRNRRFKNDREEERTRKEISEKLEAIDNRVFFVPKKFHSCVEKGRKLVTEKNRNSLQWRAELVLWETYKHMTITAQKCNENLVPI